MANINFPEMEPHTKFKWVDVLGGAMKIFTFIIMSKLFLPVLCTGRGKKF